MECRVYEWIAHNAQTCFTVSVQCLLGCSKVILLYKDSHMIKSENMNLKSMHH